MKHLEIEYKTLLSEKNYLDLQAHFEGVIPLEQSNYYFDTADQQMKEKRIALRIRTFEQSAELTLKVPQKSKLAHMEFNQALTLEQAESMLESGLQLDGFIAQNLEERGIDLSALEPLGKLTTLRFEFEDQDGIWALDKSSYLDQIDYELELEVENEEKGRQIFSNLLESYGISYQQAPSKLARFSQKLDEIRAEKN